MTASDWLDELARRVAEQLAEVEVFRASSDTLTLALGPRGITAVAKETEFGKFCKASEDVTPIVEGRGAKMLLGDLSRYSVEPHYQAQMWKVVEGQSGR